MGRQFYTLEEWSGHSDIVREANQCIVAAEEAGQLIIRVNIPVDVVITAKELFLVPVEGPSNATFRSRELLTKAFLEKLPQEYPEFVADANRFWEINQKLFSMVRWEKGPDGNVLNTVIKTSSFDIDEARSMFREGIKIADKYGVLAGRTMSWRALQSMFEETGHSL